jgi:hypothetical protein
MRLAHAAPLLLLLSAGCAPAPVPVASPAIALNVASRTRAGAGDTVWVLLNRVRPERREQFERFVQTVWRLGLDFGSRQDPEVGRIFRQTRVLYPTEANADSTYTYVFLMDPPVGGADYSLAHILRRMLPDDSADALYRSFREALVHDQEGWTTLQTLPR